jgi:hypothetical protein
MNDPKKARDCLAHCLDTLSVTDFELAVALIELYASLRAKDATNECIAVFRKSLKINTESPGPEETLQ